MENKDIYYNYDKILSYNAILNFLIGERGVGKTYGATKFVINQFLKKRRTVRLYQKIQTRTQ